MTDTISNMYKEPGNRDSEAGIQYYTPKQGVNLKSHIQPILAPRILDQDVWGKSSTVRSGINKQTYRDITNETIDENDMVSERNGTRRSLGIPQVYQHRVKNANVEMNDINDVPNFGNYPSGKLNTRLDNRDFIGQDYQVFKNKNNFAIRNNQDFANTIPGYDRNRTVQSEIDVSNNIPAYYDTSFLQQKDIAPITSENKKEHFNIENKNREHFMINKYGKEYFNQPSNSKKEQFNFPSEADSLYNEDPNKLYQKSYQPNTSDFGQIMDNDILEQQFHNNGANIVPSSSYYNVSNRVPPGINVQATPVTDQLLQASPAYVLTDQYFKQPNARLFLQDIQPKLYSYTMDQEPINSNIGISYMPQEPPMVQSQLSDESRKAAYPLISRVDPQLVRKDGTPGQKANNAVRTNWTSEYSNFQPAPGTINFEDIYDPRFNSYGDPYRSYTDINLGQVQYYYSDIDAYKRPNFITRSNVDFVEFTDPMGKIKPYYNRTASLDDVRSQVESERTADELFFRQSQMESLMAKRNGELWQLREAPLRKTANSNMSYGPT